MARWDQQIPLVLLPRAEHNIGLVIAGACERLGRTIKDTTDRHKLQKKITKSPTAGVIDLTNVDFDGTFWDTLKRPDGVRTAAGTMPAKHAPSFDKLLAAVPYNDVLWYHVHGKEIVFKNPTNGQVTFTLRAEKAPNRRGAEKTISHFGGNRCALAELGSKKVGAALASSDPIRPHNMDERVRALANVPTVVRLGMRPMGLYERAVINLPTCTWAEKSGVYENADGKVQAFAQAIPVLEETRSAGRIFWDLLERSEAYTAATARGVMAGAGSSRSLAMVVMLLTPFP